MKTENARIIYTDIIDLPHFQSKIREHMSIHDRAAQFSPFAALTGYEDMVVEEARLTDRKAELSDWELELLNQKLSLIADVIEDGQHPMITFTVFRPDCRKKGGSYESIRGRVKKVDCVSRKVLLFGSEDIDCKTANVIELDIGSISDISGELVDYMNEC